MLQPLTIALTKGRILEETLPLLASAGIEPLDDVFTSRKLIFETTYQGLRLLIIRGSDVPTYIKHGVADLGVVGKDILLEQGAEGMYELLDLNIARCRLMTAGPVNWVKSGNSIRVATKFVNVAKRYFCEQGFQTEVIKLYGAMELAPVMDLADLIVDIVDTGNTLKANGMTPIDLIADISSRLVVNKAAMRRSHDDIQAIVDSLTSVVVK
tara:strand:+ start:418 stop:1050 length:633 start_codon:yes stop_codon:yes gene_type:complete